MEKSGLIGLAEAAQLCGIGAQTLRRWIEEDGMPLRRLPKGHGVHWKDLHKCLVRRKLPIPEGLRDGPRLLLVDDDPALLLMLVDSLEGLWEKASIGTARDGRRGLEKLMEQRPDLLVTDIEMPGLSGIELCRWARQDPELIHTKILAITGRHGAEYSRDALDSGADEYITKPFSPDELRQAAVRLLGLPSFASFAAGRSAGKKEGI